MFCPAKLDYNEATDPLNKTQLHCTVLQGHPFLCRVLVDKRTRKYSYENIELPIYGHKGSYTDFPMETLAFLIRNGKDNVYLFLIHIDSWNCTITRISSECMSTMHSFSTKENVRYCYQNYFLKHKTPYSYFVVLFRF